MPDDLVLLDIAGNLIDTGEAGRALELLPETWKPGLSR